MTSDMDIQSRIMRLQECDLVAGIVVSSSTEGAPAPASQISYTLVVRTATLAPFVVSGVKPDHDRHDDAIDTIPASVDSFCSGVLENGRLKMTIPERFAHRTDCP